MTNKQIFILLACCLLSSLLSVGIFVAFVQSGLPLDDPLVDYHYSGGDRPAAKPTMPVDFTVMAELTTPSVVYVRCFKPSGSRWQKGGTSSSGSGVIISSDGYIATNNHVIDGASSIKVMLDNQSEYDAEVVGIDLNTDLALLKINEDKLPFLRFGDSDSLRVGEWVLAGGNPFNLESTVTAGIVSAKGRSIDVLEGEDRIESFIQTDASINPGNSGGALVNDRGELIGIVTAILTTSGRHEGYAFAIPGNLARRILKDLRDYGEVERAVLGVYVQKINAAQAKRLGLDETRGALIARLRENGSAMQSGLRENDVILGINDFEVTSPGEMQEAISRFRPGENITITYIRDGKIEKTVVTLLDKDNLVSSRQLVSQEGPDMLRLTGLDLRPLSLAEKRKTKLNGGLRVVSVFRNSPAETNNMEAGYLITEVNGESISSIPGMLSLLRSGEEILFKGYYDGFEKPFYYQFDLP